MLPIELSVNYRINALSATTIPRILPPKLPLPNILPVVSPPTISHPASPSKLASDMLMKIVGTFVGLTISNRIQYHHNEHNYEICGNINNAGSTIESVISDILIRNYNFTTGPKQKSPDLFFTAGKAIMEIEIKAYRGSPSFDIANYRSYIEQLAEIGGVNRKLYNTIYIIFKYDVNNNHIIDFY